MDPARRDSSPVMCRPCRLEHRSFESPISMATGRMTACRNKGRCSRTAFVSISFSGSMNHRSISQISVNGGEASTLVSALQSPRLMDISSNGSELLAASFGPDPGVSMGEKTGLNESASLEHFVAVSGKVRRIGASLRMMLRRSLQTVRRSPFAGTTLCTWLTAMAPP